MNYGIRGNVSRAEGEQCSGRKLDFLEDLPRVRSPAQLAASVNNLKRTWDDLIDGGAGAGAADAAATGASGAHESALEAWRELRGVRTLGKPVPERLAFAVLAAYFLQPKYGLMSKPERLRQAVAASGLSLPTVRTIVDHFLDERELLVEDTALRGAGAPRSDRWELPAGIEDATRQWVTAQLNADDEPQWTTRLALQAYFRETWHVVMSRKRAGVLAAKWGLEYGTIGKSAKGACSPERLLMRQIYALQIADAVKKGWELVFTDESFANARLHVAKGYHVAGEAHAKEAPTGLGARLCWLHAFLKTGLLCQYFDIPEGDEDALDGARCAGNARRCRVGQRQRQRRVGRRLTD